MFVVLLWLLSVPLPEDIKWTSYLYTYWKFIAETYMIIIKEADTVMFNNSGWVWLEAETVMFNNSGWVWLEAETVMFNNSGWVWLEAETVMFNNSGWLEVTIDFLLLNHIHRWKVYRFSKFCINDNLLFSLTMSYSQCFISPLKNIKFKVLWYFTVMCSASPITNTYVYH
jgi:hypothetical protein